MFSLRSCTCRPLYSAIASTSKLSFPNQLRPITTFLPKSPLFTPHRLTRSLIIKAEKPVGVELEDEVKEAIIDLSESAIAQITKAQNRNSDELIGLRVSVESGGCHGYQYKMEITNKVEEDDYLFLPPNSTARLLIDVNSLTLLSGSKIDYATELIGSSFRITDNPHASDSGGCGCGVSWDLKVVD